MVTSEIILITNQANKEGLQNILQQMAGVMAHRLYNQSVSVIFDSQLEPVLANEIKLPLASRTS